MSGGETSQMDRAMKLLNQYGMPGDFLPMVERDMVFRLWLVKSVILKIGTQSQLDAQAAIDRGLMFSLRDLEQAFGEIKFRELSEFVDVPFDFGSLERGMGGLRFPIPGSSTHIRYLPILWPDLGWSIAGMLPLLEPLMSHGVWFGNEKFAARSAAPRWHLTLGNRYHGHATSPVRVQWREKGIAGLMPMSAREVLAMSLLYFRIHGELPFWSGTIFTSDESSSGRIAIVFDRQNRLTVTCTARVDQNYLTACNIIA